MTDWLNNPAYLAVSEPNLETRLNENGFTSTGLMDVPNYRRDPNPPLTLGVVNPATVSNAIVFPGMVPTLDDVRKAVNVSSSVNRFERVQAGPDELVITGSASFWTSDIGNASIIAGREHIDGVTLGATAPYLIYGSFLAAQSRYTANPVHAGTIYGLAVESIERSTVANPNVISVALGIRCRRANVSNGTLTAQIGVEIRSVLDSGAGSVITTGTGIDFAGLLGETAHGLHFPVSCMSSTTTGYAIRIDGNMQATSSYSLSSLGPLDRMVHVGKVRFGFSSDPVHELDVTGGATISTRLIVGSAILPGAVTLTAAVSDTITATPIANIVQTFMGDAGIGFSVSGRSFVIGIDNSDGDIFKFGTAAGPFTALGTGTVMQINPTNNKVAMSDQLTVGTLTDQGDTITGYGNNNDTIPQIVASQAGTGDAAFKVRLGTTRSYTFGIDNSASDSFVIATAASELAALGTNNILSITTSGKVTFYTDIIPSAAKTHDIGATGNRWRNAYMVSSSTGTSRLVDANGRDCEKCRKPMRRSSGGVRYAGETEDYEIVFCPDCCCVGIEKFNHCPNVPMDPPPEIVFTGFTVGAMSGRSRFVQAGFRYGKVTNEARLGETEIAEYLSLDEPGRKAFLLAVGRREWDSLEECRLMKNETAGLQSVFNEASASFQNLNLLETT